MPANTAHRRPGPRQTHARWLPTAPRSEITERIRQLLDQGDGWVLRMDWNKWLTTGAESALVPLEMMTRDQLIAAMSWLRQQRHELHRLVVGAGHAPAGWLETTALYEAMTRRLPDATPADRALPPSGD